MTASGVGRGVVTLRMPVQSAVGVLVAALLFVACGSDGGDANDATLKGLLLTRADMPGYDLVSTSNVEQDDPFEEDALRACFDDDDLFADDEGDQYVEFSRGPTLNVAVTANAAKSAAASEAQFATLTKGFGDGTCVADAFAAIFEVQFGPVAAASLAPIDVGGAALAAGYQLILGVDVEGEQLNVYIDLVFLGEGPIQVTLVNSQALEPFSETERDRLVEILTSRLAEAA